MIIYNGNGGQVVTPGNNIMYQMEPHVVLFVTLTHLLTSLRNSVTRLTFGQELSSCLQVAVAGFLS